MSPQSREKVALAVFAILIVLSLCGLGWYLFAGHSWNVAASNIDDTFGSMEGYTAVVYAGTVDPLESDAAQADKSADDKTSGTAEATSPTDVPASSSGEAAGTVSSPNAEETPAEEADRKNDALETAASGAATTPSKKKQPLEVSAVRDSYEGKGAVVLALDTEDPSQYAEGTILKKGDRRFGVFSVEKPLPKRALERQIAYFDACKVDFIVVVTSDREYLEGISGVDIVVSTQDEELFVMGETVSGTFYVDAPDVGKVGAILISPSNVVSAKVIEEL